MSDLYRIGTVAERTGFSTHVLRAWERRYDLLDPERSDSGQRLYTARDLAVLLRVRELKEGGRRIGEIARMGRVRLLQDAPTPEPSASGCQGADGAEVPDPPAPTADASAWDRPGAGFFQAVLETLPVGVVLTGPDGRTRWVNSGFSEMCGYGLAELKGQTPGSVLQGPATDPETVTRMGRALSEGRPFSERVLNYHRSQRHYWAELDVTPLDAVAGVEGYVGVARSLDDARVRRSSGDAGGQVRNAIRSLTTVAAEDDGSSRLLMSLADVLAALPQT